MENRIFRLLEPDGSTYDLTRTIFLRFLGLIYFVAFPSLNRQVLALIGSNGLLPAQLFLREVQNALGKSSFGCFLEIPSLFWFHCSDSLLLILSYLGLILSLCIIAGAT